jgi:hypothetical protein
MDMEVVGVVAPEGAKEAKDITDLLLGTGKLIFGRMAVQVAADHIDRRKHRFYVTTADGQVFLQAIDRDEVVSDDPARRWVNTVLYGFQRRELEDMLNDRVVRPDEDPVDDGTPIEPHRVRLT